MALLPLVLATATEPPAVMTALALAVNTPPEFSVIFVGDVRGALTVSVEAPATAPRPKLPVCVPFTETLTPAPTEGVLTLTVIAPPVPAPPVVLIPPILT